jgi:hypothetical protein
LTLQLSSSFPLLVLVRLDEVQDHQCEAFLMQQDLLVLLWQLAPSVAPNQNFWSSLQSGPSAQPAILRSLDRPNSDIERLHKER